jgi:hypothetical protein
MNRLAGGFSGEEDSPFRGYGPDYVIFSFLFTSTARAAFRR